ncbi:MAG: YHS domain-containing protein [Candidatus Hydrogenedentes bacterium]|nr:YHS domain-containing protein [Candidatus Hydrogenedentota bacterium]
MNIDVLYVEGCPNYAAALTMAREAAAELGVNADIQEVLVRGPEEARAMHFLGSPSIQVDFEDIEPGAGERTDFAYAARSYGGAPLPPRAMLVAAIARAAGLEPNEETESAAGSEEGPAEHAPARAPGEARVIPTPICPGCLSSLVRLGMHKPTAVAHNYRGREYYFCCRDCVDLFERDAERYLLELKDLIVCPVCLGERYLRSAGLAVVDGVSYYTCRSPRCQAYLAEAPEFYMKRLAGTVKNQGVRDHDGMPLG